MTTTTAAMNKRYRSERFEMQNWSKRTTIITHETTGWYMDVLIDHHTFVRVGNTDPETNGTGELSTKGAKLRKWWGVKFHCGQQVGSIVSTDWSMYYAFKCAATQKGDAKPGVIVAPEPS